MSLDRSQFQRYRLLLLAVKPAGAPWPRQLLRAVGPMCFPSVGTRRRGLPHGRMFEAVEDAVTTLGTVPNPACAGAERVVRRWIVRVGVAGLILAELGLADGLFDTVAEILDGQLRRALSEAVAPVWGLAVMRLRERKLVRLSAQTGSSYRRVPATRLW